MNLHIDVNGSVGSVTFDWSMWDSRFHSHLKKKKKRNHDTLAGADKDFFCFVSFLEFKQWITLCTSSQLISILCHPNNYPIRLNDTKCDNDLPTHIRLWKIYLIIAETQTRLTTYFFLLKYFRFFFTYLILTQIELESWRTSFLR